ncbi:beta-lactamase family protein, partial [Streptomyces sp. SID7982]|nr:beta-lactamase family protein [Streptomyces sp. SID7982]
EVYRAGTSQLGTGLPPRTTDHMRIASTAKAFSGSVALQLTQRGALGLDDTIGRRLPKLPAAWHRVTLR